MPQEMTVAELTRHLKGLPQDAIVSCWKPGQHILLGPPVLVSPGVVHMEGNDQEQGAFHMVRLSESVRNTAEREIPKCD